MGAGVREGAGGCQPCESSALSGEMNCGGLIQMPFANDKVLFLVIEVENSWQ